MARNSYHALLITNSAFEEDPFNLPDLVGPRSDLGLMYDALCNERTGIFQRSNIKSVMDWPRAEIQSAIEELFAIAGMNDTALLYYSGHGKTDWHGQLFLCASDTLAENLEDTAVGAKWVSEVIENSAASSVLVILDCCHSGAFKGTSLTGDIGGQGRYVLASNSASTVAPDGHISEGGSPFTRVFAEALLDGADDSDDDGFVTVEDVYEFLHRRAKNTPNLKPKRDFRGSGYPRIARRRAGEYQAVATASSSVSSEEAVELAAAIEPDEITIEPGSDFDDFSTVDFDPCLATEPIHIPADPHRSPVVKGQLIQASRAGSRKSFLTLANSTAARFDLTNISAVTSLIETLENLGADEAAILLATRAAAAADLENPHNVAFLLETLTRDLEGRTYSQAAQTLCKRVANDLDVNINAAHTASLIFGMLRWGAARDAATLAERVASTGGYGKPHDASQLLTAVSRTGGSRKAVEERTRRYAKRSAKMVDLTRIDDSYELEDSLRLVEKLLAFDCVEAAGRLAKRIAREIDLRNHNIAAVQQFFSQGKETSAAAKELSKRIIAN
jgi:hypothetical protein